MKPWPSGYPWLMACRRGVLQYVVVQIVVATIVLISRHFKMYGEPGYGSGAAGFVCSDAAAGSSDLVDEHSSGHGDGGGPGPGTPDPDGNASARWIHVDWATVYPYTTLVISFSQLWALYCLIHFYYGTKLILQQCQLRANTTCNLQNAKCNARDTLSMCCPPLETQVENVATQLKCLMTSTH
jgi:hypothetical protein